MLSNVDLERLIAAKKREILKEKSVLGLSPPPQPRVSLDDGKENTPPSSPEVKTQKQVTFVDRAALQEYVISPETTEDSKPGLREDRKKDGSREDAIPPDLERYIRRYVGLPVMLKAGEYSPNNPLLKGDLPRDRDAFIGLGDYERRSKTLRRLRQQEYRQYLDQQAKNKLEEKAIAERAARERDRRESEREEQLLRRESAQRRVEDERRTYHTERLERNSKRFEDGDYGATAPVHPVQSVQSVQSVHRRVRTVDTGVQVGPTRTPLSVAVQTDPTDFYTPRPPPRHLATQQQAERELSPRTGVEPASRQVDERPIHPAPWINESRRRSYGDYDERTHALSTDSNRNKASSEPRRNYFPSIFDEDAIQRRNNRVEQEAAERRLFYQKELKNQIEEQQRIREERKAREKMLEMAEMRRLEEQLDMLRTAQDKETKKNDQITYAMKENARQFESKRTALQKEIDAEQKSYFRALSQPARFSTRPIHTSRSENTVPLSCKLSDLDRLDRKPFSTNIAENSIFSPNYDVDNYLRLNLNPCKESLMSNRMESGYARGHNNSNNQESKTDNTGSRRFSFAPDFEDENCDSKQVVVEKALVHEEPKKARILEQGIGKSKSTSETFNRPPVKSDYEPSFLKKDLNTLIDSKPPLEDIPIPVLRHSPIVLQSDDDKLINAQKDNSEAMKRLEGKWKVPAVQKNILTSLPSADGKNVSILTQLGSIRRQLQMEQLKLDKMLSKDSDL